MISECLVFKSRCSDLWARPLHPRALRPNNWLYIAQRWNLAEQTFQLPLLITHRSSNTSAKFKTVRWLVIKRSARLCKWKTFALPKRRCSVRGNGNMPTNDANYITVIKSNCTREGATQKIAFTIFRHRNDDINFFPTCHINLMLIRAINTRAFTTVTFDIKEVIQILLLKCILRSKRVTPLPSLPPPPQHPISRLITFRINYRLITLSEQWVPADQVINN